jgi:hypothetical protein
MNTKGQGLIETIVAVAIMVTGIVGAISLVNFSLRGASGAMNQLIALNLSWEAVEAAVNIRDSNFLAGDTFSIGLDGSGDTTAIAEFDETANIWFFDFSAADSISDPATVLYLQNGLYKQVGTSPGGTATNFRRLVTLDTTSISGAVQVISTVQWVERGNEKEVVTERILYDWRS